MVCSHPASLELFQVKQQRHLKLIKCIFFCGLGNTRSYKQFSAAASQAPIYARSCGSLNLNSLHACSLQPCDSILQAVGSHYHQKACSTACLSRVTPASMQSRLQPERAAPCACRKLFIFSQSSTM